MPQRPVPMAALQKIPHRPPLHLRRLGASETLPHWLLLLLLLRLLLLLLLLLLLHRGAV